MDKIKILFFAANPKRDLHLDEEVHKIEAMLRASEHRSLELIPALSPRSSEVIDKLTWHKPHIVHFSGHGSGQGMGVGVGGTRDLESAGKEVGNQIYFLDDDGITPKPVSQDTLVDLFRACTDNIWLAVFNACYTDPLAEALTQGQVIQCAIGMNADIDDEAARIFAARFYGSLSDGRTVQKSFDLALVELKMAGFSEETKKPKLHFRPDSNGRVPPIVVPTFFKEIVAAIEHGTLVPVLGPSINPAIYVELAAHLVELLAEVKSLEPLNEQQQKDFFKDHYGSPCSICYFLPTLT